MTRLHAYLNFAGDAEEAFNFYRSVFGREFSSLVRFKDFPMEGASIPQEEADKIMHVALPIGEESILLASDTLESLGQELVQGNNVYISVHPTSKEEADRIFNALSEGGEREMPIADQAWGDYYGVCRTSSESCGWLITAPRERSDGTTLQLLSVMLGQKIEVREGFYTRSSVFHPGRMQLASP